MQIQRIAEALVALTLAFAAVAPAQTIDDFESYEDTADMQTVWLFGSLDTVTPNPETGVQSLRRETFSPENGSGVFSVQFFDPPLDLSSSLGLEFWGRRDPTSVSIVQFDVTIRDPSNSTCSRQGPLVTDAEWHLSTLTFQDSCDGVDLSNITQINLSVLNQSGAPGDLRANFDDLAVIFDDIFEDGFETGNTSIWSATVP
ncbi:MAG: hypothetical protein MPN21_25100 [Thermoanaerobaculia bacterium]|nr:hypothetical protein [Thermoanaerobaculia bacterium]